MIHIAEGVYTDAPSTSFSVSAGGLLAYWTGRHDVTELPWVRRDGTPSGDPIGRGSYGSFRVSRNGRHLVVGRDDTAPPSIWTFDLERGSSRRLTYDDYAQIPVWSPDATRIAFGAARGSPPNLYTLPVGGTQQSERLTRSALVEFPADWSPDGEHLLFTRVDEKTGFDLWALPMSGKRVARPVLNSPFAEPEAAISPDGRWLAYSSDETGRMQVYVTTFPTPGERWPVSTAGGLTPEWSADGRELFYRDKERIMSVTVKSGVAFAASVPRVLFEVKALPRETEQRPFAVGPDGRFLINSVVERTSLPLTIVSDWRTGFGK
jgi:Tol biopolymer transport system component